MSLSRPSFSQEVKSELANLVPARPCCRHAELRAIAAALNGSKAARLDLRTSKNAVARKLVALARATGGTVSGVARGPVGPRPTYRVRLGLAADRSSDRVCCARARLRGTFLAAGAVATPGRGYHLEVELVPGRDRQARRSYVRLGLKVRSISRRGRVVYYWKGADAISRLLSLLGANRAVMRFENERILREMRGQANRRANGETANLDKRLWAALGQLEAIRRLRITDPSLHSLAPALRDAARLRLEHPGAGLAELALKAHVSKPAMAGRLRRLMERDRKNGLLD
jgi:DNA-binding transcriptional regulator WhiA